MSKDQIQLKVQDIFRDIFDNDLLNVNRNTNSNDIEDWDSLNHINLVVSVEKEFKIKFTLDELQSFKDVGDMIDLISAKTQ